MQIKVLDAALYQRWNEYVYAQPQATFFHRAEWKDVIEKALGHRCHFLYAEYDGEIVGVLPLGHVKSALFGNALISSPFCVYGGVLASDATVHQALLDAGCNLAAALGVDYLEMRHRDQPLAGWQGKDLYVTFRKTIDPDVEKNLLNIPRKQRAVVRKGIENGLRGEIDEGIDRLYDAYSQSVHALGTPVFPKRYFQVLKDCFAEDCEVLTITHQGRLVSSVMSFYFRDEVLPYYGGGTAEAREVKANDFMYWDLMRRACERGIRVFDYGRSKVGTGSYNFKKNWGFDPEPLHYQYHLVRAKQMPNVSPTNPKYQRFIKAWQRMPLGLTRLIGPLIAKNLG